MLNIHGRVVKGAAILCTLIAVFAFDACSVKTSGSSSASGDSKVTSTTYKSGTIEFPKSS